MKTLTLFPGPFLENSQKKLGWGQVLFVRSHDNHAFLEPSNILSFIPPNMLSHHLEIMIENDEFWLSTKSHFSVASLNSYDQYIFELRMELKFINERNVFS